MTPATDEPSAPDQRKTGLDDPRALDILTTEHWSLLSARTLGYQEMFGRTTIFIGVLSGTIIALALLAQVTRFGYETLTFAAVLFAVSLFIGLALRLARCYSSPPVPQVPHMFNVAYLNQIRIVEMERLAQYIPAGARVLEFGAGTGQQARLLADRGFDVAAIDLADSAYAQHLVFPVQHYDGEHIPLADQSVDVVFSSNVLEHVENIPAIMSEFRRILRPGGFGVHVMPTPAWRFWTWRASCG